jgi:hypothetical protein
VFYRFLRKIAPNSFASQLAYIWQVFLPYYCIAVCDKKFREWILSVRMYISPYKMIRFFLNCIVNVCVYVSGVLKCILKVGVEESIVNAP